MATTILPSSQGLCIKKWVPRRKNFLRGTHFFSTQVPVPLQCSDEETRNISSIFDLIQYHTNVRQSNRMYVKNIANNVNLNGKSRIPYLPQLLLPLRLVPSERTSLKTKHGVVFKKKNFLKL